MFLFYSYILHMNHRSTVTFQESHVQCWEETLIPQRSSEICLGAASYFCSATWSKACSHPHIFHICFVTISFNFCPLCCHLYIEIFLLDFCSILSINKPVFTIFTSFQDHIWLVIASISSLSSPTGYLKEHNFFSFPSPKNCNAIWNWLYGLPVLGYHFS